MIAVIDYGLGNLFSISCSLKKIGAQHEITRDPEKIMAADKLILPGVGAFRDAIGLLEATGLGALVVERAKDGVPLMGICLGMQLLFDKSYEYGEYAGLGLIGGEIRTLECAETAGLKIPHIGWNALKFHRQSALTEGIRQGDFVYYVHSYCATGIGDALVASSEYGIDVAGIVEKGNVCGTQFHPEKSGEVGLRILRGFCE